jgi:hypothetical protein
LLWRAEPDLSGLRKPAELKKFSGDERKEFLALWGRVDASYENDGRGR